MDRGAQIAAWALVASLTTACGARTNLTISAGHGGAATATTSTGSGGEQPDAGADAEAAAPCASWAVAPGEPVALTDPSGDSILTSAAVEGESVFVASSNDNDPSPDPTWRVRVVSGDLQTVGPSQVVLTHPQSVALSGMSLSTSSGHHGGIAWDEVNACRFVALAEDGSPAAPPVTVGGDACYWLSATTTGFVAFIAPNFGTGPVSRVTLDASGQVVDKTPDLIPVQSIYPLARARFDDGTMLLAWLSGTTIVAQRFGETGGALSTAKTLLTFNSGPTRVALASLGSSGLVVWAPGDSALGEVDVQPIDEDGNPTGSTTLLAPVDGATVAGLDAKPVVGGALVVWAKGAPGAADTMTVQAVGTTGAVMGPPVPVPSPQYLQDLRLAPTPAGVVLAFDAELPMTLTQVFVVRLVCGA
jgi:hypothetical protein